MPSDLLLVLTDPAIRLHDPYQFRQVCEISDARHARRSGLPLKSTPVTDDYHGLSKRTLAQAFTRTDVVGVLPASQRQRVGSFTSILTNRQSLSNNASCGLSVIAAQRGLTAATAPSLVSFAHRMPVIAPAPAQDIDTFQALTDAVDQMDESSLMPTSVKPTGKAFWYTLCLKLGPSEAANPGIRYRAHRKELHLAVDTADSSFWFFQANFIALEKDREGVILTRPWTKEEAHEYSKRRCLPRPTVPTIDRPVRWSYMDGGVVDLERWPAECDLTFFVPSWDWRNNQKVQTTKLRIPQVLARAASQVTAGQSVDGNVGFAVPGFRLPWENADETDRVTFFDILHDAECMEAIEDINGGDLTEMQLTSRLLIPTSDERMDNDRRRSFLYLGRGTPCGLLFDDGTVALPEFSAAMQIFPDLGNPASFTMWTLELVSMTLLEPLVDNPNYEYLLDNEWAARRIDMADPFIVNEQTHMIEANMRTGIRTVFDTCSGCTVLPERIVQSIWTEWFGQNLNQMPPMGKAIWHRGSRDRFSEHDLLFEFDDNAGNRFTIRCSARHFLSSPWPAEEENDGTMSCVKIGAGFGHEVTWALGMNFFWAFMVKMEARFSGSRPIPGTHNPTVRFAPQRIVRDGVRIADAWDLPILADLPPRLQNEWREAQIPELHPGDGF